MSLENPAYEVGQKVIVTKAGEDIPCWIVNTKTTKEHFLRYIVKLPSGELYEASYGQIKPELFQEADVGTCLKEIADWYIKNRREMTPADLGPILRKHGESEAEVEKLTKFLLTETGQVRFKTILRETKELRMKERMPRINPHATAIQQDKQLIEQIKWLKAHGFKTARDAQEAGY